jgi:hypothetical protein
LKVAHRLPARIRDRTAAESAAVIVIRYSPTMSIDQLNPTAQAVLKTDAEQHGRATAVAEWLNSLKGTHQCWKRQKNWKSYQMKFTPLHRQNDCKRMHRQSPTWSQVV